MQDALNWVTKETKSANFGDKRLNRRYGNLLNSLASTPNKSIPASCKGWSETIAAYRFFNHEGVTDAEILLPHKESTLERIKNEKIVLIPQDTTEIDFTGRKPIPGMGYLNYENSHGFYLHPSIAITPERLCLGVVDMQTWAREKLGVKKQRNKKPIKEKESNCWLKGYDAANTIALSAPDTAIVSITDREGDIYELLEKMPSKSNKAYWLIRSQHNRNLLSEAGNELEFRLWEEVNESKAIGEIEFTLPKGKIYNRQSSKRPPRQERIVRQEIKACTVNIKSPQYKETKSASIAIHVVHCREIDPPNDAERIEWFLLTSYPVNNAETAMEVVNWYLCRWQIEVFFKILKSGCTIEELQFDTLKATMNCIALYFTLSFRGEFYF